MEPNTTQPVQLPRWRCHKVVKAALILGMSPLWIADDGRKFFTLSTDAGSVEVPQSYVDKHRPKVGGMFVEYPDGYQSFSPRDAFFEGYAPVGESPLDRMRSVVVGLVGGDGLEGLRALREFTLKDTEADGELVSYSVALIDLLIETLPTE